MMTLAVLAAENKIGNHGTSSPCFSVKLELTQYMQMAICTQT